MIIAIEWIGCFVRQGVCRGPFIIWTVHILELSAFGLKLFATWYWSAIPVSRRTLTSWFFCPQPHRVRKGGYWIRQCLSVHPFNYLCNPQLCFRPEQISRHTVSPRTYLKISPGCCDMDRQVRRTCLGPYWQVREPNCLVPDVGRTKCSGLCHNGILVQESSLSCFLAIGGFELSLGVMNDLDTHY